MKKKSVWASIFLCVSMLCALFFSQVTTSVNVQAEIVGREFTSAYLTGFQGYYPYHYFDSLTNSTHSKDVEYLNRDGVKTSEYRAIVEKGGLSSDYGKGYANINLAGEMSTLADTGKYYAFASAGLLSVNDKNFSKLNISLSNGTNTVSASSNVVYSSGVYAPEWVQTDKVFLSNKSDVITFSFSTLEKFSMWNNADFFIFEPMVEFGIEIDAITNVTENNQTISKNSLIKLEASTFLSELSGENLIRYYQDIHKIEWEVVSGDGQIVGEYLQAGSTGGNISVRPKCLKSTHGTEYVYGETITFTVNTATVGVSAEVNFQEGATITGLNNSLSPNRYVNTFIELKEGYSLLSILDEEGASLSYTITSSGLYRIRLYVGETSKTLKITLKKTLTISKVIVEDKTYDATNAAKITGVVFAEGDLEHGVTADISALKASFSSVDPGENIKVNITGSVTLVGNNSYMYNLESGLPSVTANIIKRNIVITADDLSIEYGSSLPTFTYKIDGEFLPGNSLTGALSVENAVEPGQYTINQGTLNNLNYNIEFVPGTLTITKRNISVSEIYVDGKIYDGTTSVSNSQVHFTQIGSFLDQDVNLSYTFTYASSDASNKIKVNYSFEIVGSCKDYYNLTCQQTDIYSSIDEKPINIYAVTTSKDYGEQDPKLTYNYNISDLIGSDTILGEPTRTVGEDVGEYTITIGSLSAKNYSINFITAKFVINQRIIEITADAKAKFYGDSDPELTYSITNGSLVNNDKLGLTLKRAQGEVVGTYAISVDTQTNDNYKISYISNNLVINKRIISINVVPNNKEYDGTTSATFSVNISNALPADNLLFIVQAKFENKNAGNWAVQYYINDDASLITSFSTSALSGSNLNCYDAKFNVITTARIDRRNVSVIIESNYLSKRYGDLDKGLPFTVDNIVEGETLNGILSRTQGEDVGLYNINLGTVTNENNSNYNISFDITTKFEITKREIKLILDNHTIYFGDADTNAVYLSGETPLPNGVKLSEVVTGEHSREGGNSVGTYKYLIGTLALAENCKNNYVLLFEGGSLTIIPKHLTINIVSATKVYGSSDPIFSYSVEGQENLSLDIVFVRELGENAGTYTISGAMNDKNYDCIIKTGTLTITPANITVKANSIVKTYGEADPALNYQLKNGNLMFNDTLKSIISGEIAREQGEDVGTYKIVKNTLAVNSNYSLTFEESEFKIVEKELLIIANDVVKYYDENLEPELTYQVIGLINGDVVSGSLQRQQGLELGEYAITIGTLNAKNYKITFTGATFSIEKRKITIKIDAKSKEFDGTDYIELTYSILGDYVEANLPQISLTKESGSDVGKYLITATAKSDIYNIEIVENWFEIIKRPVVVTANDITLEYGETIPQLTYTISGDINNSLLQVTLYRNQSISAGEYNIYASFLNSENYNVQFNMGKLTINKKPITLKVENFTKIYGSSDPIFEYKIVSGSMVNGDVFSGAIVREIGENVGEYKLIYELENNNYDITINDATLTIVKKELQLVTSIVDKVYDGNDIAIIRTPTLSGVLIEDDVYFDYNVNEVAKFKTVEVGDNISVEVYGGALAGEDKDNYYLTYPTNLTASITHAAIKAEEIKFAKEIKVEASATNTNLKNGTSLAANSIEANKIDTSEFGNSKAVVGVYELHFIYKGETLADSGKITINIEPNTNGLYNVQVYKLNEDGTKTLVESTYENGVVRFDSESTGTFIVVCDNDNWLNIILITTSAILLAALVVIIVFRRKKSKKNFKNA